MQKSHERKCWDCGNVAIHESSITPGVLCEKCGSQDTLRVQANDTRDHAKRQRDRQVGEAIEYAAEKLSMEFRIEITIEHHSGSVSLYGPDGVCEFPTNHEGLADEIEDAVNYAIEQASKVSSS